jgi:hypothetical protein
MKSLLILVLVSLSAVIASGIVVEYKGNVTLVDADNFKYRATALWAWDYLVLKGVSFVGIQAEKSPNAASLDAVFGAAWVGASTAPSAYLAYFGIAAEYQNSTTGNQASLAAAAAVLATSWYSIDEIDASGNVKQTVNLKDLAWGIESSNQGFGGLRYITFVGSQIFPLGSPMKVYVTYVQSDVVGVLNVPGDPIITPKSVETILEISNFQYQSSADKLRLNFAVAAAAEGVQVTAGTTQNLVVGTGASQTYFALSKSAKVNGNIASVEIGEYVLGTSSAVLQSADLQAQITAKYGAAAVFKLVSVTTTDAGASSIIYDPSLGSGQVPQDSSASGMMLSFFTLLLLLVVNFL